MPATKTRSYCWTSFYGVPLALPNSENHYTQIQLLLQLCRFSGRSGERMIDNIARASENLQ